MSVRREGLVGRSGIHVRHLQLSMVSIFAYGGPGYLVRHKDSGPHNLFRSSNYASHEDARAGFLTQVVAAMGVGSYARCREFTYAQTANSGQCTLDRNRLSYLALLKYRIGLRAGLLHIRNDVRVAV